MGQDVTFRRVRGRIIPIRKKADSSVDYKKTAKGAALIGVGAGTAAGAGRASAVAAEKAVKFRINANVYSKKAQAFKKARPSKSYSQLKKAGQMEFGFKTTTEKLYNPFRKTAQESAVLSATYKNVKKGVRFGGMALSTALIGAGLKRGYEGLTGNKADTKEEVISNVAGAGATFALSSAYAHKKFGGGRKALVKAVKLGLRAAKIRIP